MRATAGIALLPDGTWNCGSTGGEWSPGGCGCGSGGSCGCGRSCGCRRAGSESGACAHSARGEGPRWVDYDGDLLARTPMQDPGISDDGAPLGYVATLPATLIVAGGEVAPAEWFGPITVGDGVVATGMENDPITPLTISDASETPQDPVRPPVVTAVPDDPIICGPDVTDYLVKQLMKMWLMTNPVSRGVLVTPHVGALDLKSRPGKPGPASVPGKCPIRCPGSVTICGKCLDDQIPGNIGLGAANVVARAIGAIDAWWDGGSDSAEDLAAYDVGDATHAAARAHRTMRAGRGSIRLSWNEGAEAKIKEALCKEVEAQVKSGGFKEKKSGDKPCGPCDQKWGG